MQTGIIVHSGGTRKKRFEKLLGHIPSSHLSRMKVVYTSQESTTSSIARTLANDGVSHIIGVGGDGTISDIVHGIRTSANPDCIAGFWPQGTANDWSRTWTPEETFRALLSSVDAGAFQRCDLGRIQYSSGNERFFLNIADIGIGAEVVRRVNRSPKWPGANLLFMFSIIKTLLTYRNKKVFCEGDNWQWEGKIKSVVVANGRYFGSGMAIAPKASVTDGMLDIVIIGDVRLWDYLKYLPALKKGNPIDDPQVIYKKTSKITLDAELPCGLEADGELLGETPVVVSVVPGGIRMLPPFKHKD